MGCYLFFDCWYGKWLSIDHIYKGHDGEGGSIDKSEGKCYHLLEKYKETCATHL